jgi:hypothetical protein
MAAFMSWLDRIIVRRVCEDRSGGLVCRWPPDAHYSHAEGHLVNYSDLILCIAEEPR